jgi:hypothetical protein
MQAAEFAMLVIWQLNGLALAYGVCCWLRVLYGDLVVALQSCFARLTAEQDRAAAAAAWAAGAATAARLPFESSPNGWPSRAGLWHASLRKLRLLQARDFFRAD